MKQYVHLFEQLAEELGVDCSPLVLLNDGDYQKLFTFFLNHISLSEKHNKRFQIPVAADKTYCDDFHCREYMNIKPSQSYYEEFIESLRLPFKWESENKGLYDKIRRFGINGRSFKEPQAIYFICYSAFYHDRSLKNHLAHFYNHCRTNGIILNSDKECSDIVQRLIEEEITAEISTNPYKGLFAFTSKDKNLFFGREKEIRELTEQVEANTFTAVLGGSGCGKSSLVKAGLIPSLREHKSIICRLTDGVENSPFNGLAYALIRHMPSKKKHGAEAQSEIVSALSKGSINLAYYIDQVRHENQCEKVLLVIDQFEEILEFPECEIHNFLDVLCHTAFSSAKSNFQKQAFSIVITLRKDLVGHLKFENDKNFYRLVTQNGFVLESIKDRERLKFIVQEPARRTGVGYVDGLVDIICDEAMKLPQCLPLLQFALSELWSRNDEKIITLDAYNTIGGIARALTAQADQIINLLDGENEKEYAKWLFIQLVNLNQEGYPTKKRTPLSEIKPVECRQVAHKLAGSLTEREQTARLIIIEPQVESRPETVEIIHEILIEDWELLKTWIVDGEHYIRWTEKLKVLMEDWLHSPNDTSSLLVSNRLAEAEEMLQKYSYVLAGSLEESFILRSLKHQAFLRLCEKRKQKNKQRVEEREAKQQIEAATKALEFQNRKRKREKSIVLIAFALVIFLGGYGWYQTTQAEIESAISNKRRIVGLSERFLEKGDVRLSVLTALEALRLNVDPKERDSQSYQGALNILKSANNKYVQTHQVPYELIGRTKLHDLSSDSRALVTVTENDSQVVVWDTQKKSEIMRIENVPSIIDKVNISPAGDRVSFTSHHEDTGEIWSVKHKKKILSLSGKDIKHFFLSDDETYYAVEEYNGRYSLGFIPAHSAQPVEIFNTEKGEFISMARSGCCFFHGQNGHFVEYALDSGKYHQRNIYKFPSDFKYRINQEQTVILAQSTENQFKYAQLDKYLENGKLYNLSLPREITTGIENSLFSPDGEFFAIVEYSEDGDQAHIFQSYNGLYLASLPFGQRSYVSQELPITHNTWDYMSFEGQAPSHLTHKTGVYNLPTGELLHTGGIWELSGYTDAMMASNSPFISLELKNSIGIFKKIKIPNDLTVLPGRYEKASWGEDKRQVIAEGFVSEVTKNSKHRFQFTWSVSEMRIIQIEERIANMWEDFEIDFSSPAVGACQNLPSKNGQWELELVNYVCKNHKTPALSSEKNDGSSTANKQLNLIHKATSKKVKVSDYIPYSDVQKAHFTKSGHYLLIVKDRELIVWDIARNGVVKHSISLSGEDYSIVASFYKGKEFVVMYDNKSIIVTSLNSGELVFTHSVESGTVSDVTFVEEWSAIAWVESNQNIKVKSIFSNELLFAYNSASNHVRSISPNPSLESIMWVDSGGAVVISPLKVHVDSDIINDFKNLGIPVLTKSERLQLNL